jgi:hypothetical protein
MLRDSARSRVARTLAPVVAAALVMGCPGNDPSGPTPLQMAGRFDELARAHATDQRAPLYPWRLASAALRSGAPIGSVTVEVNGQPRTFQAVAIQVGTMLGSIEAPAASYVIAWGDDNGREMLDVWVSTDSVELELPPSGWDPVTSPVPLIVGGVVLQTLGKDSLWLHEQGWAKVKAAPTSKVCQSALRQADVCRVLVVDVASAAVIRQVQNVGDSPPWPTRQFLLRPTRLTGVGIFQRCDPNACSVSFP